MDDCEKICSTPQKRRMHLIDKHMFPRNYEFLVVNLGIDKRSSMLRSRRQRHGSISSEAFSRDQIANDGLRSLDTEQSTPKASFLENQPSTLPPGEKPVFSQAASPSSSPSKSPRTDFEDLTTKMSALRFVPSSVRFGRGGRRGGLSRS